MIIDSEEKERRYLLRLKGAREKKVYIGPQSVSLKMMSSCNLRCQYCATNHAPGNPRHLDSPRFIPLDKLKEIINDCVDLKVDEIELGATGEPTVHHSFSEVMNFLEFKPLRIRMVTNATFSKNICSDLIKGDHVVVNLSAVTRQQYLDIQGNDYFDRVISNIQYLAALRDSRKSEFIIEINFVVNALNVDQQLEIKELAERIGVDKVNYLKMNIHEYNRGIVLSKNYNVYEEREEANACFNGWFKIVVREDCNISYCHLIRKMSGCDIRKKSLKEVWLSKQMMNMRLLGKYGHIKRLSGESCKNCCEYHDNMRCLRDLKLKKICDH